MNKIELSQEFLYNEYFINEKSAAQIGRETGWADHTIRTKLQLFQIPKPPKNRPELTKELLEQKYIIDGKSTHQIAAETGWSHMTIRKKIKGYDLGLRRYKFLPDLVGQRFGKWVVLEYRKMHDEQHRGWLCKCECGYKAVVYQSRLLNGRAKQCSRCANKGGINHPLRGGYKEITGKVWNKIKGAAKDRNLKLYITIEQIYELWINQNRKCARTGWELYIAQNHLEEGENLTTASLDRIDSTKDYTIDNVQWLHKDINRMKWDLEENYFIKLCLAVANYAQNR